ncbi:hypothetical protein CTM88_03680 [Photobacterium aquimaris]|uniref:Uncharacterized protein n=1 Tax=Photobacterium aquimaris TaxID=512643 RepID=A0A2T3IQU8_9GAMM|nr:hypothetical protein CTM88_03680 [Photobacterium aquimaris]
MSYVFPINDLKQYFAQLIKTHSWSTVRIDRNRLRKLWVSYVFPAMFFRITFHDIPNIYLYKAA